MIRVLRRREGRIVVNMYITDLSEEDIEIAIKVTMTMDDNSWKLQDWMRKQSKNGGSKAASWKKKWKI